LIQLYAVILSGECVWLIFTWHFVEDMQ